MIRRLLVTYLSITAFALAALAIPLGLSVARQERDGLYSDIERDAVAMASLVEEPLESGASPRIDAVLRDYHDRTDGRIVVVDRSGRSVGDSDHIGAASRDFSARPEFVVALSGRRATGSRSSTTLDSALLYVAVPVASNGQVHGAVRVTFPTAARDARVRRVWLRLILLSAGILAAVAAVGYVVARSVTRPVRALDDVAERLAHGDLGARAPVDDGVPEVRALAATFNATAARLEELLGSQQRFVGDAAHQLRSPLTALRLRLENLEARTPVSDRPAVTALLEEVHRLSSIVDGLLALARAEGADAPVVVVDAMGAVGERLDAWEEVAAERSVELVGPDRRRPVWVHAPEGGLEQILDNLLDNAMTVAPSGSTVRVGIDAGDGAADIHVVDQGPGLDAEQRERAFDRFWRGSGTPGGSGLGLAVVRRLARAAGGDARLDIGEDGAGVDAVVSLRRAHPT